MTKQAERLAFLTSEENLPIVLEILHEGDQIRSHLFNQFMTGLREYLQENATTPKDECELSVAEETDDECAAVYLWNTTKQRDDQYLRYSVQHSAEKSECELTLCLEWSDGDLLEKPKIQKLKSVIQLGERLKAEGLKKGLCWFRYKHIRQDDSADKFLTIMTDAGMRNSLFRQVNNCFWPLVQSTCGMVAAANEEIAKIVNA